MGLRSRRAFSAASENQILAAARAVQSLLKHVDKPINMSLLRIPSLNKSGIDQYGVVQFNDKEKPFASVAETTQHAFDAITFADRESTEIKGRLLLDLNLALAVELSRVAERALYVVHSDTFCSSGYVLFEAARAVEGVIYGWEGSEILLEINSSGCKSSLLSLEQTQYWKYASLGINSHLGTELKYGEYLEQFDYSDSAIVRYRLMLQKELVQELLPEAF